MRPTNKLRFVLKPEPDPNIPGMVSTVRKYRCLQQWWHRDTSSMWVEDQGEWRDVLLEAE